MHILLGLTTDNFTHQGESAGSQWVNIKQLPVYETQVSYYSDAENNEKFHIVLSGIRTPSSGI